METASDLVFQLAKEVLQRQERNLDELRGRAGMILAGAAIGLGLFGQVSMRAAPASNASACGLGSES